jgi:hypothetical protein
LATFYRVVSEVVADGHRTYLFKTAVGAAEAFTRSCDPRVARFMMGVAYSLAEIDARCPDELAP